MMKKAGKHHWCVVPMCKNTGRTAPEKLFLSVPRDAAIRKQWWSAIRRAPPIPTTCIYCCEDHFDLEHDLDNYTFYMKFGGYARLKAGVQPHKFVCQGRVLKENTNRGKFRRKRILQAAMNAENSGEAEDPDLFQDDFNADAGNGDAADQEQHQRRDHCPRISTHDIGVQVRRPYRSFGVQVAVRPRTAEVSCGTTSPVGEGTGSEGVTGEEDVPDTSEGMTDERMMSMVTNEDTSPDYLPPESSSSSDDEDVMERRLWSLQTTRSMILNNTKRYLGLEQHDMYIIDLICDRIMYKRRGQVLAKRDAVLMILTKIRTGIPCDIVADMFGMSKGCFSRIFARFVPVIADSLKTLVRWPPSFVIRNRLPNAFKAYYHQVESIIDCFEIQIEKPSAAMLQSMSWSDYKKCNSIKFFISATPDGLINFVSEGRPGRCSDMALFRSCGYLDCLRDRPCTTVLADRGFKELEADLAAYGCRLVRPASVGKGQQLTASEAAQMKTVAGLRIHIERVIGRLRVFRMLDIHSCVPLSMVDLIDSVVLIVCGLANLQQPVVQ